jgi:hypothetical protein
MKNKGVLITLAIIGVIAIAGVATADGFFWWRGGFGGGCCIGNQQWNTFPRMRGGMMWGGGWQTNNTFSSSVLSLEEAEDAINDYINGYRSDEELHIGEIMIFDNHAYAEVVEESTGIGAFEVLVDPSNLTVFPEMGPNMIWNLKYGHMRAGMMGSGFNNSELDMPISGEDATQIANEYLTNNGSDLTVGDEADTFYGYYTIHTLKDGEVYGMLSVNGYDGEVYIHTWHGSFIEMTEHENDDHTDS